MLEDIGCAIIMPLGSPIGLDQSIKSFYNIQTFHLMTTPKTYPSCKNLTLTAYISPFITPFSTINIIINQNTLVIRIVNKQYPTILCCTFPTQYEYKS